MINRFNIRIIGFALLAVFLVSMIAFLFFVSPEEMVNKIGIRNGYIAVFLVSIFGGFSAGGSVSFISLLILLSAGGINPVYLGLVSGGGLMIGDIVIFYLGLKGRKLVKGKWNDRANKVTEMCEKKKWLRKTMPIAAYLYISFAPLPNDILILFLAAIKYPVRRMIGIIILGDLTFALLVAILAGRGML